MATTAFTEQLRFITTTVIGWMDVITRPQHKHIAVDTTISNDNMNSYYRIANADTRCGRIANPTKRKYFSKNYFLLSCFIGNFGREINQSTILL